MAIKLTPFLLLLYFVSFFSCDKPPSNIPFLEFVSVSKSFMLQNSGDSLFLVFSFTDGDGNLGSDTSDNIFVKDSRNGLNIATYKMPDYLGSNPNNISRSGEVTVVVYAQCCIYPDSSSCHSSTLFPERTMKYQIQIVDNNGNFSNIMESSEITLDCS
jgi:hypothetical protein